MSTTDSSGRDVSAAPAWPDHTSEFPELGFYVLPGHSRYPREALAQVQLAEELGVGNVMLSERPDYKEASAVCGALAAVTERIFIGTSATNLNTRHPVIGAAMASTLHRLSEGRFALGLAKGGGKARWDAWGLQANTWAREAAYVDVLRRLWRGEAVSHDGPLGSYPRLHQASYLDEAIPLLYVGFGPQSLEHAGGLYDGAHLHTFMGEHALRESVAAVRRGEAAAGRAPGTVKVWSVLATCCDLPEERRLKLITARLATYLQIPGYGELLVRVNGWDPDDLAAFRAHPVVKGMGGLIDSVATTAQLAEIDSVIPAHWRPAAVGSPEACARAWLDEFERGADGVIIHASTPEEFAPVLDAWRAIRPAERFAGRSNRPA